MPCFSKSCIVAHYEVIEGQLIDKGQCVVCDNCKYYHGDCAFKK